MYATYVIFDRRDGGRGTIKKMSAVHDYTLFQNIGIPSTVKRALDGQ